MTRSPACWPSPRFARPGGDGASAGAQLRSEAANKAAILVREETGLRFEPLVLFAEPLFEHYQLDADEAFALRRHPELADEATVAALEAARVLWAYFSLPEEHRPEQLQSLSNHLLGPVHSPEDEADLDHLLDRMEEHWHLLTAEDRRIAEGAAAPTLDFEALMVHPVLAAGPAHEREAVGYGPNDLNQLEAQALFAQPMLDGAEDPDEMEASLERAHTYWEIAHHDREGRETQLGYFLDEATASPKQRALLQQEARRMLDRFDELFPEHAA